MPINLTRSGRGRVEPPQDMASVIAIASEEKLPNLEEVISTLQSVEELKIAQIIKSKDFIYKYHPCMSLADNYSS